MLDRWASNVMAVMGEKTRDTQLFFRLDFATHGWQIEVPLQLCNCSRTKSQNVQPTKRWIFVKTNSPGNATTLTLKCSWCSTQVHLKRPQTMSAPRYSAGEYYHIVMANHPLSIASA
jgi:hypothetical protein